MSEPVLSAEEWRARSAEVWNDPEKRDYRVEVHADPGLARWESDTENAVNVPNALLPALIALANAALPASDPAKITRERIRDMRETADLLQGELRRVYGPESNWGNVPMTLTAMAERVIDHADALARYLPPE